MSLDKSALETLKLDRTGESPQQRDYGSRRTRRWVLILVALALLGALAWRLANSTLQVHVASTKSRSRRVPRSRRGRCWRGSIR